MEMAKSENGEQHLLSVLGGSEAQYLPEHRWEQASSATAVLPHHCIGEEGRQAPSLCVCAYMCVSGTKERKACIYITRACSQIAYSFSIQSKAMHKAGVWNETMPSSCSLQTPSNKPPKPECSNPLLQRMEQKQLQRRTTVFQRASLVAESRAERPEEEEGRAETSKQSRDSTPKWRPCHAPAHREGHILSPLKSRQWFSVTRSPVDTRAPETWKITGV